MLVPRGGGGLYAGGDYQQEASSSVLFENCWASGVSGALAVEEVLVLVASVGKTLRGFMSTLSSGRGFERDLFAIAGYQQETLSSLHFEHCLADSALAVEDVDGCFGHRIRVSSPRYCVASFRATSQGRQVEAEDLHAAWGCPC